MDGKGRLTIPSQWRQTEADQFYFMPDSSDRYLRAMRPEEFAKAARNPDKEAASPAAQHEFLRWFCARAHLVTADKQGRLVLPEALRSGYGMGGEVVLVGSFDWFEVWNKELFEAERQERLPIFRDEAKGRGW